MLITEERLILTIRIVGATEPDRIYNSVSVDLDGFGCSYRPNMANKCGCIVGEALIELGVPAEVLQRLDDSRASTAWTEETAVRLLTPYLELQALKSPWVFCVQQQQDQRQTWGQAIILADQQAAEEGWLR